MRHQTSTTTRASGSGCSLVVTFYVIVSAGLAVATSDACDGALHGDKTWQLFPPHWECPGPLSG